jgi:hypothetical protein
MTGGNPISEKSSFEMRAKFRGNCRFFSKYRRCAGTEMLLWDFGDVLKKERGMGSRGMNLEN